MELGQHAQQHTIRTLSDGQPGAAVGAQEGHLDTLQGRVERLESIGGDFDLCGQASDVNVAPALGRVGRLGGVPSAGGCETGGVGQPDNL